jgi:O-antigen/teichoic acid export membrane protein
MKDLKQKTLRGGIARVCNLIAAALLRLLSVMTLARLLSPKDFGLVGMVTAFTGILTLFRDFGLSSASVQRETITEEQKSTLFWINLCVGALLSILALVMAPLVASFYHEPRLAAITAVLACAFLINSSGVQHSSMLQREMRFTALSVVNTLSSFLGLAVGIVAALAGYGYWSLVMMTIASSLIGTVAVWLAASWIPGLPRRRAGLRSILHFGTAVTAHSILIYVATNFEKVLLGRFWGADAIGIYGRAYQLSNIPVDNLNSSVGEVAFAALSRLQGDPARLRSYFLKGYFLVVSLTLPITIISALFAHDIILTLLGQKWKDAIPVFRLLAPTTLVFGIVNPLGWLLFSLGKVGRLLKMALVITPILIGGYLLAIPHGPTGVAFAYSTLMVLWIFPAVAWGLKGMPVSARDFLTTASRPLIACGIAGGFAFMAHFVWNRFPSTLIKLVLDTVVFFGAYLGLLLYALGQKEQYIDLFRGLRKRSFEEPEPAAAGAAERAESTVCI